MENRTYEDRLGDGLTALLEQGADSLEAFCAGLNEAQRYGPRGEAWTAALLADELARLGGPLPGENPTLASPHLRERPGGEARVAEPSAPAADAASDLLETGLMNLWYLVARSSDVTDRPVPLRRLSRNLVLWRDGGGALQVLEDYCPHRGAPLSMGRVVEGSLACVYHGVRLNGQGVVTAVPPTPDCPMVGEKAIKAYPCREFAGAIWVWFGDELHSEPPEPAYPEELTSDEWSSFLYSNRWNCNWQITIDNRVDPIHGSFLHADTFTLSGGRKDARLDITPTEHGFETARDNQRNTNIDWHEVVFRPGNTLWVTTEIPYPASAGGGTFRINGAATPIDRDATLVWWYRSRKLSGWKRHLWRFLFKNRIEERGFRLAEQDRVLLEKMSLAGRARENLIQTDVAVSRMRRLLAAEAQRQIDALAGQAPAGSSPKAGTAQPTARA